MGIINPYATHAYKGSSFLFSKIRRELHSFDAAGLLDEGEFHIYVKEILREFGLAVFKEDDAVININDYKGKLPSNFSILEAAYKCTANFGTRDRVHEQGSPITIYHDVQWELIEGNVDNCKIDCCENNNVLEKVVIRQFVKEKGDASLNLTNPILLRLSPNVKKSLCTSDCKNLLASSYYEITIDDGMVYTNFEHDAIYMKYYGIPMDEDGLPMIPDIHYVEKAIEAYIKYQVLFGLWINNQVPDLETKWKVYQMEFERYEAKAKHENKMPTFGRMVNQIRRKRNTSALMVFAQMDNSGYWMKN